MKFDHYFWKHLREHLSIVCLLLMLLLLARASICLFGIPIGIFVFGGLVFFGIIFAVAYIHADIERTYERDKYDL